MSPEDASRKPLASPGWPDLAVTAKQAMCEHIVHHCVRTYRDRLSAIVLAGSMARDEATFVRDGKDVKLLGDADCALIFRKDASLPADSETASLEHAIENIWRKTGCAAKWDFRLSPHDFWRISHAISRHMSCGIAARFCGANQIFCRLCAIFRPAISCVKMLGVCSAIE